MAASAQHDTSRRAVIVVSYSDGSAIRGVYGPYPGPGEAEGAMKGLQRLPGMSVDDDWAIFALYEVATRPPKGAA